MAIKLFSLNIEGDKHFGRWLPVVLRERPDVLCLQEVFADDMEYISQTVGMTGYFIPLLNVTEINRYNLPQRGLWGMGYFTQLQHSPPETHYYVGGQHIHVFQEPSDAARALVVSSVTAPTGERFRIATTHFTWTHNGEVSDAQRTDCAAMLKIIENYGDIVLCGDFNAPRGKEIFNHLASVLQDALPREVTTTLDPELHYKKGAVHLAVDTIFYSKEYQVNEVRVLAGISDHYGLVAAISRT